MDKSDAIKKALPPRTVKEVRSFVGLANFFRKLIPKFAYYSQHQTKLIRQDSKWKKGDLPPESLEAFKGLQAALCSDKVMAYPNPNKKYHLVVDAATGDKNHPGGLGAALMQFSDKAEQLVPVAYASRGLTGAEKNYSAFLLELQAASWAIGHFHHQLIGKHFLLQTDHRPLTTLTQRQSRTLNRLQQQMLEHQFSVIHRPGTENEVADWLSRHGHEMEQVNSIEHAVTRATETTGIPRSTWIEEQAKDSFCQEVVKILEKEADKLSSNHNQHTKALVTKTATRSDGLLWVSPDPKGQDRRSCLIVPKRLAKLVLTAAHNSSVAGHGGNFQTRQRVMERFWWPGMAEDIAHHLKECPVCAKHKTTAVKRPTPLQPLPQCSSPNERIHVDLFGPLLHEDNEKAHVLVVTDAFSKNCRSSNDPEQGSEDSCGKDSGHLVFEMGKSNGSMLRSRKRVRCTGHRRGTSSTQDQTQYDHRNAPCSKRTSRNVQ